MVDPLTVFAASSGQATVRVGRVWPVGGATAMNGEAVIRLVSEQMERILWTARSAGGTLIISRGHDPDTIRQLLDQGLIRERLGHLVLTPKGTQQRRACAPF